MAIDLDDQRAQAHDDGLRVRVEAASVRVAFAQLDQPVATGTGTAFAITGTGWAQQQRMALAVAIVADSDFAVEQFTWFIVVQPSLPSIDAITDNQIVNFVANNFDKVAQMLMHTGVP